MPVELELASLWAAVSDMTLGRLAGLYVGTVWFDKFLHFGNSLLIGLLAFLIVYALQFVADGRNLHLVLLPFLMDLVARHRVSGGGGPPGRNGRGRRPQLH